MSGPIRPSQVGEGADIPEAVFDVVNSFLRKGHFEVSQDRVLALLEKRGLVREQIFAEHWLDFEESYRKVGWKVDYERPDRGESGPAVWRFQS